MKALVAVLPGDGVGPEVTAEAVRALEAAARASGHTFTFTEALIGGVAIDASGRPLPYETLALCRRADAVLLGAVGGRPPRAGEPRPEEALLELRQALGTFANLRPVRAFPSLAHATPLRPERLHGTDMLFVRELTGGIYFGKKKRSAMRRGGERATDLCTYTTAEIERVVRTAATLAMQRRNKLTSVDKANVLETSRLWRDVTTRIVLEEFPGVNLEHVLVDAFAMQLLQRPAEYDVIVTENMFGDILTDEAAVLAGSIGLLPSASLRLDKGGRVGAGIYEPIHGSAPDIAGRNLANPVGAILSAALLLRHSLGLTREADALEHAVAHALESGLRTSDLADSGTALGTREFGKAVTEMIDATAVHPPRSAALRAARKRTSTSTSTTGKYA